MRSMVILCSSYSLYCSGNEGSRIFRVPCPLLVPGILIKDASEIPIMIALLVCTFAISSARISIDIFTAMTNAASDESLLDVP